MALGSVNCRCSCVDENGQRLGKACPKLKRTGHGSWFYRIELPPNAQGLRRPRRRTGFDSRAAAQAELDKVRELLALPEEADIAALCKVGDLIAHALTEKKPLPDPQQVRRLLRVSAPLLQHPTVGQWLDGWLKTRKNITRNTFRSYESHIRLYLNRYLGELRLDKLKVEHVADMFEQIVEYNDEITRARASKDPQRHAAVRYQRPVRATSMQRIRATLRKSLNDAIRQELITFNAAQWVESPPKPDHQPCCGPPNASNAGKPPAKPPPQSWSGPHNKPERSSTTPSTTASTRCITSSRTAGYGEARPCGLRLIDTHLGAGSIEVLNQIVQHGWKTEHSTPKTEESMATVALDPTTVAVLEEHKVLQRAERRAAGTEWIDSGLMFTQPDGSALHPADVTSRFQFLTTQAGLPPIRLHDLRHGAATLALAAGVDMKVVQAMLRHADITTTTNTYTSVLPEVARAAAHDIANSIPRAKKRRLDPTPVRLDVPPHTER